MPPSWDRYCLPPLPAKEGKNLSGNVSIKYLDRKAYSQAVLSLLGRASCLERPWVRLFKGAIDPQLLPAATNLWLERSETSGLLRVGERKGVQNSLPQESMWVRMEGVCDEG